MTSYPINSQLTSLKVNSEDDIIEINPSLPGLNCDDDAISRQIECAVNEGAICVPPIPLTNRCNNLIAPFKVKGGAVFCKGVNIGFTETTIEGNIRFNNGRFQGYNKYGWQYLDCCNGDANGIKITTNNTICSGENHVGITPDSGMNTSISIGPLGTGFISAQTPTPSSAIGGDCRGVNAVDWQQVRSISLAVAKGDLSFIGGGADNAVFSKYGLIVGGKENISGNISGYSYYDIIVGGNSNEIGVSITNKTNANFIGGGTSNQIGIDNDINSYNVIVGGNGNYIRSFNTTYSGNSFDNNFIGGGGLNRVILKNNSAGSSNNVLVGGSGNQIVDGVQSIIVGGIDNYIKAKSSFIGGGFNNKSLSDYDFIGGGKNNYSKVNFAVIGGGYINTIATGTSATGNYQVIVGGKDNKIGEGDNSSTQNSFIGSGYRNSIGRAINSVSNHSVIVGGYANRLGGFTINSNNGATARYSFIGSGKENLVGTAVGTDASYSIIVGGRANRIGTIDNSSAIKCFIGGGDENKILGGNISGNADFSVICGGVGNIIEGATVQSNFIGGGRENKIYQDAKKYNTIVSGYQNYIKAGSRNSIISGSNNQIITGNSTDFNTILVGTQNIINNSRVCMILSGLQNQIINSQAGNVILGGRNNTIQRISAFSTAYNVIIGDQSTITDADRCVVFGTGINATTSNTFYSSQIRDTSISATPVHVNASGLVAAMSSSKRFKRDIIDIPEEKINLFDKIKPKQFKFEGNQNDEYGIIAEELYEIYPELILYDKDNQINSLNFNAVHTLTLANVQKLIEENKTLRQEVANLRQELTQRIQTLEDKINQ